MIKLENDAKAHEGSKAGLYERASDVNGKPSYRMGNLAIWYYPNYNKWIIGHFDKLGIGSGHIYARNNFTGLTDEKNIWMYFDRTKWKAAETNDIIAKEITGTFEYNLATIIEIGYSNLTSHVKKVKK